MNGSIPQPTRSPRPGRSPSRRRTASRRPFRAMPCYGCINDAAERARLGRAPAVLQNEDPDIRDLAGAVIVRLDNREAERVLDVIDERAADKQRKIDAIFAGNQREARYLA